jgi:hypothetical protein
VTTYPPRQFPLSDFATGTFKSDGTLTVSLSPESFESWDIELTGVFTDDPSTSLLIPQADLYQASITPTSWRGGTYSGNKDQSTAKIHLERNEPLYCVWTGGTAGRTGTVAVSGWKWS